MVPYLGLGGWFNNIIYPKIGNRLVPSPKNNLYIRSIRNVKLFLDAESTKSKKPYIIPKPFLDENILRTERDFDRRDKIKEFVMRRKAFSDDDAKNWAEKWPTKAPFDPYRIPFPLR